MMGAYATVFAFALVAAVFGLAALAASALIGPRVPDAVKSSVYECGIEAQGTTEVKTNIRFYIFALLFVIFDVETLFVFPWAVTVRRLGPVALVEMLIFLGVLFFGLVYAWKKGALEWEMPAETPASGRGGR